MGKLASAQLTGPRKMVVGADGPIFAMVRASAEAYGPTDYACSADILEPFFCQYMYFS
jgi:hypothetical protein